MKMLWLHGIYLSVIGVLGFQLWTKTVENQTAHNSVMIETEKILKENNIVLHYITDMRLAEIERYSSTNPLHYNHFGIRARTVFESSKSFTAVLARNLSNLEKNEKVNVKEIRSMR